MNTFERWFTQDLNKPILPQHGQGLVFTGDDGTPLVGVHVTRNGAPADLSGTVSCTVIRVDGTTVPVTGGTISGGDVSVVLSSACFNIRGPIGVALAVTSGSTTMTVLKAMFQVDITSTGNIIDPSGEITLDVANLIADIDAAVASIPADYSDLLAAIAPTFSASTAYAAGAYAWYNGNLYRFTAAHATGAWTGTDAAQVALAGEVTELKSALYSENIFDIFLFENGAINVSDGSNVNSTTRIRLKGFLPWSVTTIGSTTSKGFLLYAWDKDGNYVGGWKNGSFGDDVAGVSSLNMTSFYRNPAFSGYKYKIVIYSAQIDTITGVYINNLSIENLFARGAILSLNNVTILPNGTDFNTLTTAGNYIVENYSQISTHTNTPPDVTTGGRLFVYYDIANTRPVQVWISFDRYNEPLIWIRRMATNWTKWCRIGTHQPVNLRVLGYNIGAFNWGNGGGLSENVEQKIANYKKFFGSVNPDIMLFAEMATNIDSSGTYPSDSTLLAPLFVKRANFHQNAADTNLTNAKTLESDGGVYLRNNNNEYAGAVVRLVCDVYNKKLIMSGGFLRVLSTAQDRLEAFQNYLTAIADYDYSVIYLDTNVQDDAERQNIYNAAVSAGYQVCNGGYFGLMETLVPTSMYKPIDNIFVKGNIKIKNFYVASSEYENLSSDHIPVIADLTLY